MSERVVPGPVEDGRGIREAVCIHTKKIYDSCRDRDCAEDLRFYPTRSAQGVLERAASVRGGQAELLHVAVDVEPASYHRGFYAVDLRYYYKVTADAFVPGSRPGEICGLAVFDKRVILFGSQGSAKTFSSQGEGGNQGSGLPEAVVEAVDPIVLSLKLVDPCRCPPMPPACPPYPGCQPGQEQPGFAPNGQPGLGQWEDPELTDVPPVVLAAFGSDLSFESTGRRLYVTLGQFSLIRLERDSQLLIPVYDYCLPTRTCPSEEDREDDPCEAFRQIRFPVGEFFPPNRLPGEGPGGGQEEEEGCGC